MPTMVDEGEARQDAPRVAFDERVGHAASDAPHFDLPEEAARSKRPRVQEAFERRRLRLFEDQFHQR